jgi:hypothetical protein
MRDVVDLIRRQLESWERWQSEVAKTRHDPSPSPVAVAFQKAQPSEKGATAVELFAPFSLQRN